MPAKAALVKAFVIKFKRIFLPFLIIAGGIIAGYTFLNWLLFLKLKLIDLDIKYIEFFIPMALPWVPLFIWLRPRIKLLRIYKTGRSDSAELLFLLSGLSIFVPLMIGQMYIETATGSLTRLSRISQITRFPKTRYYTSHNFHSSKSFTHAKTVFEVSGKQSQSFNMYLYLAVPIFDHVFPDTNQIAHIRSTIGSKGLVVINGKLNTMKYLKSIPVDSIRMMRYINPSIAMVSYGDTGKYGAIAVLTMGFKKPVNIRPTKISPSAWLMVRYTETIDNSLSMSAKERLYKNFIVRSDSDFKLKSLDKFAYLDTKPFSTDRGYYEDAIRSGNDVAYGTPILLTAVNEPFDDRNGNKLAWAAGIFFCGCCLFLIALWYIPLKRVYRTRRSKLKPTPEEFT